MALIITQRPEAEVPRLGNPDQTDLMEHMRELEDGFVLEIESGNERTIRGIKVMIARASGDLHEAKWDTWDRDGKVYTKRASALRQRHHRRTRSEIAADEARAAAIPPGSAQIPMLRRGRNRKGAQQTRERVAS